MDVNILSPKLSDQEMEDVLLSEGIMTWGPDGERFERMFTFVINQRRINIRKALFEGSDK